MSNKDQVNIPTITREQRIMLRAKSYIKGEISLDEFAALERLDEAIEELESEQLNEKTEQQAAKLKSMYQEEKVLTASRIEKNAKLNLTKEEWNKLHIYEQQELYDKYPDEVRALLGKAEG